MTSDDFLKMPMFNKCCNNPLPFGQPWSVIAHQWFVHVACTLGQQPSDIWMNQTPVRRAAIAPTNIHKFGRGETP
jgi:hypothetical protein